MKNIAGVIFLVSSLVATFISLLHRASLPDQVPMHFDLSGQVNRYGSRQEALWFIPLLLFGFSIVFGLIGVVSGVRLRVNATKGLNIVALATSLLMLFLHNLILSQNYAAIPTMVPTVLSGLLIVIGFAIKDVEPNPFIGIRVPWTMSSPMVWRKTHERASRIWIIAGAIGLILCLLHAPLALPILIFVGAILYPVLDSYRISKAI